MKKFQFKLQPILRYEEYQLAEALNAHAQITRYLEQALQARRTLLVDIENEERAWEAAFAQSPQDRHLFMGRDQTLLTRRRRISAAGERVAMLEELLEQCQEKVDGHRAELARLEKVRENQLATYLSDVRLHEQKELDELSLTRYARRDESLS